MLARKGLHFQEHFSCTLKTRGVHSFEVIGGKKLQGEITPQGAKNEALQIISAVLLTPEKMTISNIPDILDVNLLIELLGEMGVKIDRISRDTCIFQASTIHIDYLRSDAFRNKSGKLRGSVMLAGPMLARFRKAFIPKPGGDKIGRRRLDTHIIGFEKLGEATGTQPKSLIRMFGPRGNPQARNLFSVLGYLQKQAGIELHVAEGPR